MSQKYLYVPALVNLTLNGFGAPEFGGSPLSRRTLPLYVVPLLRATTAGFSRQFGSSPLNQNGLPAASLTPVTVVPCVNSGSGLPLLPGRSTCGTRPATNDTVSPTLIVTRR